MKKIMMFSLGLVIWHSIAYIDEQTKMCIRIHTEQWWIVMNPLTLDTNLYALKYKFVVEPRRMCVALVLPYFY